jgi:hypothetical protein
MNDRGAKAHRHLSAWAPGHQGAIHKLLSDQVPMCRGAIKQQRPNRMGRINTGIKPRS